MERAAQSEDLGERVENLRTNLRITIYTWVSRGLFQRDIEIFLTAIVFQLLRRQVIGEDAGYSNEHLDWLMKGGDGSLPEDENSIEWLPDTNWASCNSLGTCSGFETFVSDFCT